MARVGSQRHSKKKEIFNWHHFNFKMKSADKQTDRHERIFHNGLLSAVSIKEHIKLVLVSFFVGFVFVVGIHRAVLSFAHIRISLKRSGNH